MHDTDRFELLAGPKRLAAIHCLVCWAAMGMVAAFVTGSMATRAVAADGDSLRIRFVGNAGFEVSDGVITLMVDLPYRPGAFRAMRYDPRSLEPRGHTVSLITHRHQDHFESEAFLRRRWQIIGPSEITKNYPERLVIPLDSAVVVGAFTVFPQRTPHADTENYAYLVTWNERRLYFSGDTDDPSFLLGMKDLDIAFVTPWLDCKIADLDASIDARMIVLFHHGQPEGKAACQELRVMEQGEVVSLTAKREPGEPDQRIKAEDSD